MAASEGQAAAGGTAEPSATPQAPTDTPEPAATQVPAATPEPSATAEPGAASEPATGEAKAPTSAAVKLTDGSAFTLTEPLSLEGDLALDCDWRLSALALSNLREIRRRDDGRYALVDHAGGGMAADAGRSALIGNDEWGPKRILIADTASVRFEGGAPGASPVLPLHWEVSDACGQIIAAACEGSTCLTLKDSPTVANRAVRYGQFTIDLQLESLVSLARPEAGASFTARLSDGYELANVAFVTDTAFSGQTTLGQMMVPVERLHTLKAVPAPARGSPPEPTWSLTDKAGKTLDVHALSYSGGTLAGYDLRVSEIDFGKVSAITSTRQGFALALPAPLGQAEVITGSLSGGLGAGATAYLPAEKAARIEPLKLVAPGEAPSIAGIITLASGQQIPVTDSPDGNGISLVGELVEFWPGDLYNRGFRVNNGRVSMLCTVNDVCPEGSPVTAEGRHSVGDQDTVRFWLAGRVLNLEVPWQDIQAYSPAQQPQITDVAPTAAVTLTGWNGDSIVLRVSDVRFMQTQRLGGGWICINCSDSDRHYKQTYASMSVVDASDGVTRTIDVASLSALEFDVGYGDTSLAMRLTSRRGGMVKGSLDPSSPSREAFYYDRSREGLIADAGNGVSVIIPFQKAKRIELGWLK
jgi:hypothetical protein